MQPALVPTADNHWLFPLSSQTCGWPKLTRASRLTKLSSCTSQFVARCYCRSLLVDASSESISWLVCFPGILGLHVSQWKAIFFVASIVNTLPPLIVSHSLQPSIPHRLISSSTFLSSPDDPRLLPCSTVPDLARPVNLSFSSPSPGQRESELDPSFDRHSDCERICHLLLCVSEAFDNAATSGGLTITTIHHFRLLAQRLYILLI